MKRTACPTPAKTRCHSPGHARLVAAAAVRRANEERKICPRLYWYPCRCGSIHLSKREPFDAGTAHVAADVPEALQRWAFPRSRA